MRQGTAHSQVHGIVADSRHPTRQELKASAIELSRYINLASWLGKNAANKRGRLLAYRIKAAKVSLALVCFGALFRVLWVERHPTLGPLATVRLADKSLVNIPWQHLGPEAQARVPLPSLRMQVAHSQLSSIAPYRGPRWEAIGGWRKGARAATQPETVVAAATPQFAVPD